MGTVTVEVSLDTDEALEHSSTGDLVRELASRGSEVVLDALIMLKTGRIDDGIAALEAEFFPRYADEAECRAAYQRAMSTNPPQKMGGLDGHITKALGMTIAAHCGGPDVGAA